MFTARMKTSLLAGAFLGIICILGAGVRMGYIGNSLMLLALWYNRVLMGLVIGLASNSRRFTALMRGAILGLFVSLAFFLSTEFADPVSFVVGIVYGMVIDYIASQYSDLINRITASR